MTALWYGALGIHLCSWLEDDVHELGFVPRDCAIVSHFSLPSPTVIAYLYMCSSCWFGDGAMTRLSLAWRHSYSEV